MPNTAQTKFSLTDDTVSVTPATAGVYGIMVSLPRGPVNDVSKLFTNWEAVQKLYGGLNPDFPDTFQVKEALERGTFLRICNVRKAAEQTKATQDDDIVDDAQAPKTLFELPLKYSGAGYNNVIVSISDASNGDADSFNLTIVLSDDVSEVRESYPNLSITGAPTVAESTYLQKIVSESQIVDVIYKDLSGIVGTIRPVNTTISYSGGSDLTLPEASDFEDAIPAFDAVDDIWGIAAPSISDTTFNVALAAYADVREDIRAMLYIGTSDDKDTLTAARVALNLDSEYTDIYCGDYSISTPYHKGAPIVTVSPMGAILGLAGASDSKFGPWYSFVGPNRGVITRALGVTNNYGTKAKLADLNILANHQINTVILRDGKVMVWGNFTAQKITSQKSYTSIMKLYTFIKRSMGPTIETFIEEPLDLILIRKIYNTCKPFLNDLNSSNKRALQQPLGWEWNGDQNASSIASFTVNDPVQFGLGKYKVKLRIKPINSLQELEIEIILTPAGVTFSA